MRQVKNEADFLLGTKILMAGLMELAIWPPRDEQRAKMVTNMENIRDMLNAAPFVSGDLLRGEVVPAALDSPEKAAEIASIAKAFANVDRVNSDLFGIPVAAGMTC